MKVVYRAKGYLENPAERYKAPVVPPNKMSGLKYQMAYLSEYYSEKLLNECADLIEDLIKAVEFGSDNVQ